MLLSTESRSLTTILSVALLVQCDRGERFLRCAVTVQSDRDWAHENRTLISYNQS